MQGFIILALVAAITLLLYARSRWNSMRKVDQNSTIMKLMFHLGIFRFLIATGMAKRFMRPKSVYHYTASNGFRTGLIDEGMAASTEEALKLKVREDDIFIITYPKAGTTWMQQIVWLIYNEADTEIDKDKKLVCRIPFLEMTEMTKDMLAGIQTIEKWPTNKQRLIKTHLPYELLPEDVQAGKKCKMIYVARNAKDVCVSYYCFHLMNTIMLPDPGKWREFLEKYVAGDVLIGSWFPHVLKYWEIYQNDKDRLYFTTYEALKKDLKKEIVGISKFIGKNLTDEQIDIIYKHSTFGSMKDNNSVNNSQGASVGMDFKEHKFMRKGEVGDWKNYFTLNQNEAFDKLYKEKMKDSGLDIPFEL